jgi:hypothetical protein
MHFWPLRHSITSLDTLCPATSSLANASLATDFPATVPPAIISTLQQFNSNLPDIDIITMPQAFWAEMRSAPS